MSINIKILHEFIINSLGC